MDWFRDIPFVVNDSYSTIDVEGNEILNVLFFDRKRIVSSVAKKRFALFTSKTYGNYLICMC
jgi:hypothetical protein